MTTNVPPKDDSKKRYTLEEFDQLERKPGVEYQYHEGYVWEVNESAVSYNNQYYTVEEYLEMERASPWKHEYFQGEIIAMSGAGRRHNFIFTNVFGKLCARLENGPCHPFGSDMRMHVPENTLYTYPDISIYCGDPITTDKHEDTLIQPTIIIEILSESTRDYDRGKKFSRYKDIPTLKEYMLIETEVIGVDVFRIDANNRWVKQEYNTLQETVQLPTAGVSLSMQEIYKYTRLAKMVK